jgi:hypothetical protein
MLNNYNYDIVQHAYLGTYSIGIQSNAYPDRLFSISYLIPVSQTIPSPPFLKCHLQKYVSIQTERHRNKP